MCFKCPFIWRPPVATERTPASTAATRWVNEPNQWKTKVLTDSSPLQFIYMPLDFLKNPKKLQWVSVFTSLSRSLSLPDRGQALHEVHQPGVQSEAHAVAETDGRVWSQDLHGDQVSLG